MNFMFEWQEQYIDIVEDREGWGAASLSHDTVRYSSREVSQM